jgi:hypothetical protein
VKVNYLGNNNIHIQYDNQETETMQGSIVDCFETLCSWTKDGEPINFHIKNTNENEIAKLQNHIENKINRKITQKNDNHHRVKIKTEYTARNIIKDIYHKYNKPSTYRIDSIREEVKEPIEQENDTSNIKRKILEESDEESGFDMLQNLL